MRAVNHGRPRGVLAAGRDLDRAPNVPIKHVAACPDCAAAVGDSCTTSNGAPHRARRRMAIRALNAARTAQEAS